MKKTILMAGMMLASVCAQAQLKVESNGYIGLGCSTTSAYYRINSAGTENRMRLYRAGTPSTQTSITTQSLDAFNLAADNYYNIAIKGYARRSNTNNSGRAYGVWGEAGNTTSGYNYGVFGTLYGSQNGAGVYGTTKYNYGTNVGGIYAGFFDGDVKITGFLSGTILSTSATSSITSVSTQTNSVLGSSTNESISDRLSQLSPVCYNLNVPIATMSATSDTDTMEIVTLSDSEIQILEKNHYGFNATELQAVFPDLVYEDQHGELCINYIEMVPLLVQSIKELQSEITALKRGNVSLMGNSGTVYARSLGNNATSVEESTSVNIPTLTQNDPNPFTESTTIGYSLPESVQSASIHIYDMNGTQIHQLSLSERGDATVTVSGGELKAGMYLYSLIADGKVIDTKRMILTK